MTKDDYFKQNTECRATGIATCANKFKDYYICGKIKGPCSMMRCVTIHNNGALSCAEIIAKKAEMEAHNGNVCPSHKG